MAVVASRSALVGALLRTAVPSNRHSLVDFLRGLSRDELECLAEFQGACILESDRAANPYKLLADFFDPGMCLRWQNAEDRAHKTFVVLVRDLRCCSLAAHCSSLVHRLRSLTRHRTIQFESL